MYCLQCICSFIKNELQLIEIQYFYCKLAVAYLLLTVFNDCLIFPLIPFRLLVPCEQRSLPLKEPYFLARYIHIVVIKLTIVVTEMNG